MGNHVIVLAGPRQRFKMSLEMGDLLVTSLEQDYGASDGKEGKHQGREHGCKRRKLIEKITRKKRGRIRE